jgi:hypothetical protein
MCVLHLIDSGTPAAGPGQEGWQPADLELRACGLLKRRLAVQQMVLLLGPVAAAARAARLGTSIDALLCPPLGRPELAWRQLRRLIATGSFDLVHCWSANAARLARLAGAQRIVHASLRDGLAPPFEACALVMEPDATGAGVKRTLTLGLLGRGEAADAMRFMSVLAAMDYAGMGIIGILPACAKHLSRARRFAQRLGSRVRFVDSDAPSAVWLAGADLALWLGGEGHGAVPKSWFIAEAHCLGIPVVTVASSAVGTLREAYPQAQLFIAANATIPEVTRILIRLVEDAHLRIAAARAVREHMAASGFADQFVEQVAARWAREGVSCCSQVRSAGTAEESAA